VRRSPNDEPERRTEKDERRTTNGERRTAMINVLGLGNVLMGDDGFGPAVVQAFEAEYVVGPQVSVVDVGTPGLDLTPWLADVDRVIIVDTVKSDLPPGTLRVFDKAGVLRRPPSVRIGPHDPGLKEALQMLDFADRAPREVALIGVVPERTEMAVQMSPALQQALPLAVEAIAALLARFGDAARRRAQPAGEPAWWSKAVA
jgi:hydrogenase maturation protease